MQPFVSIRLLKSKKGTDMSRQDTKQRIMDAAVRIFSRKGFSNTTMRQITTEAAVNLAAVNYHFGTKENLIEEILKSHVVPLNRERKDRLDAVQKTADKEDRKPRVEEIMRAFIEPVVANRGKYGMDNMEFVHLVAGLHAEQQNHLREMFINLMIPTFTIFFDTLCEVLSHVPKHVIFNRMMFAIGSMIRALFMKVHPLPLPDGIETHSDRDALIDILINFVTAGMEAPWNASGN